MNNDPKRIFIRFWFPVIVYSGIIFWVSSWPSIDTPPLIPHLDKFLHVVEFGIFGLLLGRALRRSGFKWTSRKVLFIVLVCSFFYGLSDEYHQSFVPGRNSSFIDVLADTVGGFLGGLLYIKHQKKN